MREKRRKNCYSMCGLGPARVVVQRPLLRDGSLSERTDRFQGGSFDPRVELSEGCVHSQMVYKSAFEPKNDSEVPPDD
jgi:hypothetical protein